MFLVIFIAVFAFYFSNNLWPMANFKMRVLISDIQNTKVALALQPGVFFKSDNFSIRVKEKDKQNDSFKDILIYDHSYMKKQTLPVKALYLSFSKRLWTLRTDKNKQMGHNNVMHIPPLLLQTLLHLFAHKLHLISKSDVLVSFWGPEMPSQRIITSLICDDKLGINWWLFSKTKIASL